MNRRALPMRMSSSPGIVAAHRSRGAYARRQLQPNPTMAAVPGNYWAGLLHTATTLVSILTPNSDNPVVAEHVGDDEPDHTPTKS